MIALIDVKMVLEYTVVNDKSDGPEINWKVFLVGLWFLHAT